MWSVIKKLPWFLYNYFGIRFIVEEKIYPPRDESTGKRKPSSFMIWLFGVYIAIFGFAYQKYEREAQILENRYTALLSQLGNGNTPTVLSAMLTLKSVKIPIKPIITSPSSVYSSLVRSDNYSELDYKINQTINLWSNKLNDALFMDVSMDSINIEHNLNNFHIVQSSIRFLGFDRIILDSTLHLNEIWLMKDSINDLFIDDAYLKTLWILGGHIGDFEMSNSHISNGSFSHLTVDSLLLNKCIFSNTFFLNFSASAIQHKNVSDIRLKEPDIIFFRCIIDSLSYSSLEEIDNALFINCSLETKVNAINNIGDFDEKFILTFLRVNQDLLDSALIGNIEREVEHFFHPKKPKKSKKATSEAALILKELGIP